MFSNQLYSLVWKINDYSINKILRGNHDSCIEIFKNSQYFYQDRPNINIMWIIIMLSVNRCRPCPINHFENNIVNANWCSLGYRA